MGYMDFSFFCFFRLEGKKESWMGHFDGSVGAAFCIDAAAINDAGTDSGEVPCSGLAGIEIREYCEIFCRYHSLNDVFCESKDLGREIFYECVGRSAANNHNDAN